ncbi:MAG: hypothetical protein O7B79_01685 [SAR324 cluster bacterium]|nr:hypothetical protein [SAR324 cluster bacterium]
MASWIRFRFENGDSTLVNADESYFVFKSEERQIEVYSVRALPGREVLSTPICVYTCDYPDQVSAAEELIFEALGKGQHLTLSLEYLDEQAEYFNHVTGVRMVLQLLHQGTLRIPMEDGLTDGEMFDREDSQQHSEISQFEEMLHTYLDVPDDTLRRAIGEQSKDVPFGLSRDHDECPDHGYHQYWIVETRPDRSYNFRHKYDDLVKTLIEREGLGWQDQSSS